MNGPASSGPPPLVDNVFGASTSNTTRENHPDCSDTPAADGNMAPRQPRPDAAATSLRSDADNAALSTAGLEADESTMTEDESCEVDAAIPVSNPFSVLSTENTPGNGPSQVRVCTFFPSSKCAKLPRMEACTSRTCQDKGSKLVRSPTASNARYADTQFRTRGSASASVITSRGRNDLLTDNEQIEEDGSLAGERKKLQLPSHSMLSTL